MLDVQVLGQPGRDNALLVTVSTGRSQHRLLFDCGEGVLSELPVAWVQEIEAVYFSHFHFDHIAGFDSFFRLNWRRDAPVRFFGPPGTTELLHHRFRGVTWNLVAGVPGEVHVHELHGGMIRQTRFLTSEGFAVAHADGVRTCDGAIDVQHGFEVRAIPLNHGTISLGYTVREPERANVDTSAMVQAGLKPGPWLQPVKDLAVPDDREIAIDGRSVRVGELRRQLMRVTPGDSVAYLTDFLLSDADAADQLVAFLRGCRTLVCENNYRDADAELARKHFHMTSSEVGQLAARVGAERLILFHLSDRYVRDEWRAQLAEVRRVFPAAVLPAGWGIE
jgi:ribonuclease Z